MSMLCSLYRINADQVNRVRQLPESITELLGLAPAPSPPKSSIFSKLFGRPPASQAAAEPNFRPIAATNTFELDGAWHVLHFLFSGRSDEGPWPASFLISGGEEIGPDQGYGPARLVDAKQIGELDAFLKALSYDALNVAYKPDEIEATEIYWQAASTPSGRQEELDGLWELVTGLRRFVQNMANAGDSMVVSIY